MNSAYLRNTLIIQTKRNKKRNIISQETLKPFYNQAHTDFVS
ncbi:hypothetical protein LMG14418_0322 [Lactococcus lactis subsp. lactis]|nr:hypothetical protein LMG14418_0322 [Lactococcus lactis subsp. lactis]